jgi:ribosome-binding factor A
VSQRVSKMESLIQAVVASELPKLLDRDAAAVTVTRVDAAPDLRNATVWIGLLGAAEQREQLWARLEQQRGGLQSALAAKLATKYVPRLHLRQDTGGEYAEHMERLLRGL